MTIEIRELTDDVPNTPDVRVTTTNPFNTGRRTYYFDKRPSDQSKGILTPKGDVTDTVIKALEREGYEVR